MDYDPYADPFLGPTIVEIPFPSGKIIVSDDLRKDPDDDFDTAVSINYGRGRDELSRLFAERRQIAQVFVGNTSPSITRQPDGSLVVATGAYDDVAESYVWNADETVVAKICTDLWWTMIADYGRWLADSRDDVDTANSGYDGVFTLIDIQPGLYRWTAYGNSDFFVNHTDERVVYATLERIGDL